MFMRLLTCCTSTVIFQNNRFNSTFEKINSAFCNANIRIDSTDINALNGSPCEIVEKTAIYTRVDRLNYTQRIFPRRKSKLELIRIEF